MLTSSNLRQATLRGGHNYRISVAPNCKALYLCFLLHKNFHNCARHNAECMTLLSLLTLLTVAYLPLCRVLFLLLTRLPSYGLPYRGLLYTAWGASPYDGHVLQGFVKSRGMRLL